MRFLKSRYQKALEILESYDYPEPFALHLNKYFRSHKYMGSKDRKAMRSITFDYWRSAPLIQSGSIKEDLAWSICLHNTIESHEVLEFGLPSEKIPDNFNNLNVLERLNSVRNILKLRGEAKYYKKDVPAAFQSLNSDDSYFFKPKVWMRSTDTKLLPAEAEQSSILPGAYSLDTSQNIDPRVQIQDLSSQVLCSKFEIPDGGKVWDCCAGAGGKTLNRIAGSSAQWYVSDLRENILENAKRRLKKYDVVSYTKANLEKASPFESDYFDVIIADVPCSGSGTWFRNPEHFLHFDYAMIERYVQKQRKIVMHALSSLKPGGSLYYLTCSLFAEENEDNIRYFNEEFNLTVKEEISFNGLEFGADSMFMAVLQKPLQE